MNKQIQKQQKFGSVVRKIAKSLKQQHDTELTENELPRIDHALLRLFAEEDNIISGS